MDADTEVEINVRKCIACGAEMDVACFIKNLCIKCGTCGVKQYIGMMDAAPSIPGKETYGFSYYAEQTLTNEEVDELLKEVDQQESSKDILSD